MTPTVVTMRGAWRPIAAVQGLAQEKAIFPNGHRAHQGGGKEGGKRKANKWEAVQTTQGRNNVLISAPCAPCRMFLQIRDKAFIL